MCLANAEMRLVVRIWAFWWNKSINIKHIIHEVKVTDVYLIDEGECILLTAIQIAQKSVTEKVIEIEQYSILFIIWAKKSC